MTHPRLAVLGFDDATGYSTAARRVAAALEAVDETPLWLPVEQRMIEGRSSWSIRDTELAARPSAVDNLDAAILQLPPDQCVALRERLTRQRKVLSTVWETDQLPSEWDGHLLADAFVVPTEWNAELLRDRGLQNVAVIPHAVGLLQSKNSVPLPVALPPDAFVFYVINTWSRRKAMDVTLNAYLRAFTATDDVVLVIKTEAMTGDYVLPRTPTWKQVMDRVRVVPNGPKVMLVTDHWTDDEITALHDRSDCFLSLAHSEGWGLGIFDAVLAGNGVITTGWGAPAEYLPDHAGLVACDLAPAQFNPARSYGNWAEARVDDAIDRMRAAYRDRGVRLSADSRRCAERLRERCSLHAVGNAFLKVCGQGN